jgi:hypothetical protein
MKKKEIIAYAVLTEQIKKDKAAFAVYTVLRLLVIGVMIRSAFIGRWESVFTCFLCLLLFLIPSFIEKRFSLNIPTALEIIAYCFAFSAEILGEIGCYYMKYPFWDTMLHTVNGFMFAAFGFCLVDIFNKHKKFTFELSPVYMALVSFFFSMTVGVLWEFFEYFADLILYTDMQKDSLVNALHTVILDPAGANNAIHINGIATTLLTTSEGIIEINGYIDIGLHDTMKDLLVNFVGAVIFCMFGYFYVKHRGKGKIASSFIPVLEEQAEKIGGKNDENPDGIKNGDNGKQT